MARVEVYVKTTCPFCIRVARLLEAKRVEFDVHVVDSGGPKKQEMVQRAGGRTTVPQVFIGERHVGGCDDLFALEREGKLDRLLAS